MGNSSADADVEDCHSIQVVEQAEPTLVSLGVSRAVDAGNGAFWEVVHDAYTIELTAVTNPDDGSVWSRLVWTGAGLQDGSGSNKKLVSRAAVLDVAAKVSLAGAEKSAEVHVVDLTALTSTLPEISAQKFKAYVAAGSSTILTATTNPNRAEAWGLIAWTRGTDGDTANQRKVSLDAAGDVQVTAKLGQLGLKEIQAEVHICAWPKLEVKEVTFCGPARHTVEKDTAGDFDNKWTKGRLDTEQSPLCYTKNTKIELAVVFTITAKPTEEETVKVRGTTDFNGTQLQWLSTDPHIKVASGAAEVTLAATLSDNDLPDVVACYDPLVITWEMTAADGAWKAIGTTTHVIYATLGKPTVTPVYWTLLDYSCRAAQGKSTADDLVTEAFGKLKTTIRDDQGLKRKRDNQELTYYKFGRLTASTDVLHTKDLLTRGDGTARCMAWARFFVSTCQLHGITAARVIGVKPVAFATAGVFIVKNCTFNGPGSQGAPFTHEGNTECVKDDGLPGQGKSDPQFTFNDHALVLYGGLIYDPSYGVGPYADVKAWETAAIAGLGKVPWGGYYTQFTHKGTSLFIPPECSKGFIIHTIKAHESMDSIAGLYGVADGATLFNHGYNRALQALRAGGAGTVQVGDAVLIPREISTAAITYRFAG
jgi:hypothetical protein